MSRHKVNRELQCLINPKWYPHSSARTHLAILFFSSTAGIGVKGVHEPNRANKDAARAKMWDGGGERCNTKHPSKGRCNEGGSTSMADTDPTL